MESETGTREGLIRSETQKEMFFFWKLKIVLYYSLSVAGPTGFRLNCIIFFSFCVFLSLSLFFVLYMSFYII